MASPPYPVWEQAMIYVFAPPVMAVLFRVMARGWANTVQGGRVSETTVRRQRGEFWSVLGAGYVMVVCILLYSCLSS